MTDTAVPEDEALYIGEQTLNANIRKYLVHLAALAKSPIVLSVHGRSQGISADIHNALSVREQKLMPRKEEIAAHEMTDPHNMASIALGRQELSDIIAAIAVPLANYTWANEINIDLQIGHGLPSPYAPNGMAVCMVFDCKHGTMRQRFAFHKEEEPPNTESEVLLGMTVVCRPGKIGTHQIHDESDRSQLLSLLQSDAALFQWTLYTLLIIAYIQQDAEIRMGEEMRAQFNEVRSTLQAIRLAIRMKLDQDAAIAVAASDQQTAPVTIPALDQVRQSLQAISRVSPRLAVAIVRLEQTLQRLIPAVQAHAATHNQIAAAEHAAASETMREKHPVHHTPSLPHAPGPAPEEH